MSRTRRYSTILNELVRKELGIPPRYWIRLWALGEEFKNKKKVDYNIVKAKFKEGFIRILKEKGWITIKKEGRKKVIVFKRPPASLQRLAEKIEKKAYKIWMKQYY